MSLLDKASLILVPGAPQKASEIFAAKPVTQSIGFTRIGDTATRVNQAGLIESVPANTPRIDFTGGGCGKLLLEPQRTNIATYNEANAGTWGAATPTASGTMLGINAFNVQTNLGLGDAPHNFMASEFAANTTYSARVFVDFAATSSNVELIVLIFSAQGAQVRGILVDKTTKEITNVGSGSFSSVTASKLTQMSGEIYLVEVSVNFASGLTGIFGSRCFCYNVTDLQSTRIAGLQVEQGEYCTSYIIKNTTASATRGADVCSKTGISSLIGQTEGTVFVDFNYDNDNGTSQVVLSLTGDANLVNDSLSIYKSGANVLDFEILKGGTAIGNIVFKMGVSGIFTSFGRYKIAFSYQSVSAGVGTFLAAVNGQQVTGTITSNAPMSSGNTLSRINLGAYPNNSFFLENTINAAAIYTSPLTTAELARLTRL